MLMQPPPPTPHQLPSCVHLERNLGVGGGLHPINGFAKAGAGIHSSVHATGPTATYQDC